MGNVQRLRLVEIALATVFAGAAEAQVPAGPEFQVNTYTTGDQDFSTVAMGAAGDFVVAWESDGQDGSGRGVFGQLFDPTGNPRGAEFRVNSYTTGLQEGAALAMDATGNFIVAWSGGRSDGHIFGASLQRFDASGATRGNEILLSTYTTGLQGDASVAVTAAGDFVVTWDSFFGQDGYGDGIFGQCFDASGIQRGSEFQVNTYTTSDQRSSSVAVAANGDFVVTWDSFGQDGYRGGIFGQRFDALGRPRGAEFRVNIFTGASQDSPGVAMDAAGDFVVAWYSFGVPYGVPGIFARRFDASGTPQGAEFRVNTSTTSYRDFPSVAMDAVGDFVVSWVSFFGQDGSGTGVFGQRFDALGGRRGAEFRVNAFTTGNQDFPSVAMDAVGNFVVTWSSLPGQDGSGAGVFGQRFGGLLPASMSVDGAGNSVWEPGEAVEVKPSWRNVNGSAQTFGGTLASIAGPPGATYGIADDNASYGTVPNNTSASCTDCYAVTVSNPSSRPATHWDASVVETITPDGQGQVKRWLLHIGRSFTDVPATSAFYGFIETLLHKGVTGGCTGIAYCPSASTTREQMAVFVLVASEGAVYLPPACGTPAMFSDVPASSPFCRWVEELARRGVTGGCGSGNFCPSAAVSREQMAVFVLKTLEPALDPPACAPPNLYGDVPETSPFCRWIEELTRRGVVSGCGGGNYCPGAPVIREQMAVFIGVTFGLTLYGP